ncbi:MAG: DUF5660 family protein [Candidatus Shapirobacteria bacterium]|jgi:hypothetical protein
MAGGFGFKQNSKNKNFVKNNSSEILNNFQDSSEKIIPNLFGTLFPGQSIEFNHSEKQKDINWNKEFLTQSLSQEQAIFINNHDEEVEQTIKQLRLEIKKLSEDTEDLDIQVQQTIFQDTFEINQYQLNFFERIKRLIINFRQNINKANIWLESFNHKKSKRNAFWNKAKSKNGGEQYLMSSEHSASRSAN